MSDNYLIQPYRETAFLSPLNMIQEDAGFTMGDSSLKKGLVSKLNDFVEGKDFDMFDVPTFLEKYRKKSYSENFHKKSFTDLFKEKSVSEGNLSDYSVKLHFGKNKYFWRDKAIWGDTNYQFVLCNYEQSVAFVGFEFFPNALLISQIQGVKGKQNVLKPIKWSNALLNIATSWAENVGIPKIWVLPAERNKWKEDVGWNKDAAKMYYDVTAKRERFKFDNEKGVYVKKLI